MRSLLGCGSPLQRFWVSPQEISQRPQNAGTTRRKMAVKVYQANKSLQLPDILRGGTRVDCGGVLGRRGRTCCQNHMTEYFRSWNGKITIFQIDGKASGGQGRKKNASK